MVLVNAAKVVGPMDDELYPVGVKGKVHHVSKFVVYASSDISSVTTPSTSSTESSTSSSSFSTSTMTTSTTTSSSQITSFSTTSASSTTTTTSVPTSTLSPGVRPISLSYGGSNSTIPIVIIIRNIIPVVFELTQLNNSGDIIEVLDNGVPIGFARFTNALVMGSASENTKGQNIDLIDSQKNYQAGLVLSPDQNLKPASIVTRSFPLLVGNHSITLRVIFSNNGGGNLLASVKASAASFCPSSAKGLYVTSTLQSWDDGAAICLQANLQPANINIFNFDIATQVAFNCSGQFSATYIGAYWQNTYNGTCLALYTGVATPGAAISVPDSCDNKLAFMCQGTPLFV